MYTQDQINAMTAEQLKAAIIELQAAGAIIVTDATAEAAGSEPVSAIQTDIENIKEAIAQFEMAGAKLFPDELAAMKQKLADMEAKAAAEIEEVKEKEATWAENFRAKHGVSWQVAFIGGAFVLWQAGAAVARALGVI